MSFKDWLFNYNNTTLTINYTAIWIVAISFLLIMGVAVVFIGRSTKISLKTKKIILLSLACISLFLEVFGRVVFLVRGDELKTLWPLYPCQFNSLFIIVAVLTNSRMMKRMAYTITPVGALITFVFPQNVFSFSALTFPIVRTIILHANIILIPLFEYSANTFRCSFKDVIPSIYQLFLQVANSFIIVKLLGNVGDYMYFNSGYPFTIPGVPGWLIVSSTAILSSIVIHCLYLIRDRVKQKTNK